MKTPKPGAKRSPLKEQPLHNPGESLQADMQQLMEQEVVMPLAFAVAIILFVIFEWVEWFLRLPPQPVPLTGGGLLFICYAVYKIAAARRPYRNLRLGMEGEKSVGQLLEDLRGQGCRVFHDVAGDGFNLDHVIVSPRGVYVVETKTYSKPARGQTVIRFDGERVLVNGFEPERNPVVQARAGAAWLQELLRASTGRKYPVRGVIVFPGWYVDNAAKSKSDVWALNPQGLASFIAHEPVTLADADAALIGQRIAAHVQDADRRV